MTATTKCLSCEEPIEPTDTHCPVCNTKQKRPESLRAAAVAAGLVLPGVTYCIAVGRYPESIVLAIGLALAIRGLTPKSEATLRREMADRVRRCRNFQSSKQFLGCDGKSGVAVDRAQNKICLLVNDGKKTSYRVAQHSDILSAQLIENGRSVLATSRESLRAKTIDNSPSGESGAAVVAALVGKPMPAPMISQICLRILIKGSATLPHDVAFLSAEVPKGSLSYGETNHVALNWFRIIDGLIQRAELEEIRARNRVRVR